MHHKIKKLNFGSGKKLLSGYLNVDITNFPGTDMTFDFNKFPYPFKDNYFSLIFSDNVLEHLEDIPKVMSELHRIGKPGSLVKIVVPYYNCYGAYNDVTHKHYFSHKSFEPFYQSSRANYFINKSFRLVKINLIPTRLGKMLLTDKIRLPLSFVFGQIFQTIDITLKIVK